MSEEFLKAADVARRLNVTSKTVLGWAREGRVPATRLSRKVVRFNWAAVCRALGLDEATPPAADRPPPAP